MRSHWHCVWTLSVSHTQQMYAQFFRPRSSCVPRCFSCIPIFQLAISAAVFIRSVLGHIHISVLVRFSAIRACLTGLQADSRKPIQLKALPPPLGGQGSSGGARMSRFGGPYKSYIWPASNVFLGGWGTHRGLDPRGLGLLVFAGCL